MRQVATLAILALLVLAVAGVTTAREPAAGPGIGDEDGLTVSETNPAGETAPNTPEPVVDRPESLARGPAPATIGAGRPAEPGKVPNSQGPNSTDSGRPDRARGGGKPEGKESASGKGRQKVSVCHKGKTLTVGAPAKAAHLRHGDSLGMCVG